MLEKETAIILGQALFASNDSEENITDALFKIAYQLKNLGLADAGTSMGAIEVLSQEIKNGAALIADALGQIANSIENGNK